MMIDEKKLQERGKRLYKNYRWNNAMYDSLDELQGHVCAACGQPPKEGGMRLVVDHYHFKIEAMRLDKQCLSPISVKMWYAITSFPDGRVFQAWGTTKKLAVEAVREQALPASVRGLLCPGRHGKAGHGSCNRLIGRIDNIPWLKSVIHYLENPPAQIVLDKLPSL